MHTASEPASPGIGCRRPGPWPCFYLGRAGEVNGSSLSHNKYFFQSTGGSVAFIGTLISFGSDSTLHLPQWNGNFSNLQSS